MPNGSDRPPLKTTSLLAGTTLRRRKIGTRRHTRSLHGPLAARGTSKFSWCRRLLAGPAVRANNSDLSAARHTELAHDLPHMNFDGTFPHPSRGAMALFVSPRLRSSRTARCLAVRLRFLAASSKSFLAPLPPPMTQEGMVMQSIARRICAGSVCAGSFRTVILSSPPLARFWGAISSELVTLWADKIQSTTDAGSLNTFGRNGIEVAPISSALLRIACLVILYKTCRVPDQELAADGVSGPV